MLLKDFAVLVKSGKIDEMQQNQQLRIPAVGKKKEFFKTKEYQAKSSLTDSEMAIAIPPRAIQLKEDTNFEAVVECT